MEVEETSDNGFPLGFPEVGTWNRTHNVPLENMKIDAPMVRTHTYVHTFTHTHTHYTCSLINVECVVSETGEMGTGTKTT